MRLAGAGGGRLAAGPAPAHGYFVERYERSRTHVTRRLRELETEGKLREGLGPDSAATLFQAVLNGLQAQWLLNQRLDIIEPLNRFLDLILVTDGSSLSGTRVPRVRQTCTPDRCVVFR